MSLCLPLKESSPSPSQRQLKLKEVRAVSHLMALYRSESPVELFIMSQSLTADLESVLSIYVHMEALTRTEGA